MKDSKKKPTKTDTIKKAMVAALEKSLGIATSACKAVGIARSTHYQWLVDDIEYKAAVDGITDIALDFAESKLHKQIEKGDTIACIFYLKTKGKKRGYIERNEHDLNITKFEAPQIILDSINENKIKP